MIGKLQEILSMRDKLFKKFKIKPPQHGLGNLQREKKGHAKNNQTEEKTVSWGEIVKNTAKPKQLWQTFKWLGLPNKKNSPSNICFKSKNG